MSTPALDDQLRALNDALAHTAPPERVDRAIAQAIASNARRASRRPGGSWLGWPLALAASIFALAFVVRQTPPAELASEVLREASLGFLPVASAEELARATDAYVVPASLPRTTLAQFGLPVNPQRIGEPVDAELLVRPDGAVLALRFVD